MKPRLDDAALLTPRRIFDHLDRYVVGQGRAKRALAVAAYNHQKRVAQRRLHAGPLLRKSNVLLIGPTGSGKTHLARNLADVLEVPFTVVDATEYTEAGYYGKDVEVMVAELLFRSNHAVEETQRGIIFIDEIDKIARRTGSARTGAGSRDIGGEGVQQALLKLLEGREIFVPLNVTQHWTKHDFVQIDTTDILFICAGTFTDLQQERALQPLGFGPSVPVPRRPLGAPELTDYGMLAEFVGRLQVVVELEPLGEDELVQVLSGPPDALAREYREVLALDGVELELQASALHAVAHRAIEKGVGARGLRAVLEEVMAEVMFEAPERRGTHLVVDEAYVQARLHT
ncbi:MAG: ATP-dependent Clp protease ATP-binding subunit ClpX [Deltaproteobacteria bacterium]|nr:ATP-dependent Clp protease ATP-binding subunit ClpX [Deltaproteobacteria bacterium]